MAGMPVGLQAHPERKVNADSRNNVEAVAPVEALANSSNSASNTPPMDEATNPITGLLLTALVIFTAIAVSGGKSAKWKLLNLLVIVGFSTLGFFVSFAFNEWSINSSLGVTVAIPLIASCGIASALVCIRQNKKRRASNASHHRLL